jgi:hypothetical protein
MKNEWQIIRNVRIAEAENEVQKYESAQSVIDITVRIAMHGQ